MKSSFLLHDDWEYDTTAIENIEQMRQKLIVTMHQMVIQSSRDAFKEWNEAILGFSTIVQMDNQVGFYSRLNDKRRKR